MVAARLILCAALLAVVPSCASFTERPLLPRYVPPPEQVPIRLSRSGEAKLQVGSTDWIKMPNIAGLDESAADAIWHSGWVRPASADEPAREFSLHVVEYQGRGPALLSTATAFLIPDAVDHGIELQLVLHSSEGPATSCARSAEVRTWYQTFLILVYPFKSPAYNRIKSTEAIALQCLAELLTPVGHASPSR